MTDIGPPKHLDPLHHGRLRDLGGNYSKLKVVTQGIHMSHQSNLRSGVSDQTQKTRKSHIVHFLWIGQYTLYRCQLADYLWLTQITLVVWGDAPRTGRMNPCPRVNTPDHVLHSVLFAENAEPRVPSFFRRNFGAR